MPKAQKKYAYIQKGSPESQKGFKPTKKTRQKKQKREPREKLSVFSRKMRPKKGSPEVKTRQKKQRKKNLLKTLFFFAFFPRGSLGSPDKNKTKKHEKNIWRHFLLKTLGFLHFFLGAPWEPRLHGLGRGRQEKIFQKSFI